jgi:cyanate permease
MSRAAASPSACCPRAIGAVARLSTALQFVRQLNRRSVIELVNQYWHILLGSWAIKAGLTVVAGRWYVRRRAARRAAAALAAVEALWEDERS